MPTQNKPDTLTIEKVTIPSEFQPYHNAFSVVVKFKGIKPTAKIKVELEHGRWVHDRKIRVSLPDDYENSDFRVTTDVTGVGKVPGLKDSVLTEVEKLRAEWKPSEAQTKAMDSGASDSRFKFTVKNSTSGNLKFSEFLFGTWELTGDFSVSTNGDTLNVTMPQCGSYHLTDKLTQEQIAAHNWNRPSWHDKAQRDVMEFVKPVAKRLWDAAQSDRHAKEITETERELEQAKDALARALSDEKKARKEMETAENKLESLRSREPVVIG